MNTIATTWAAMLAIALAAPAFAHGKSERHVVFSKDSGAIKLAVGDVYSNGSDSDRRKAACASALAKGQEVVDALPGRHIARRADHVGLFTDGCSCVNWLEKATRHTVCTMAVVARHPSSGSGNSDVRLEGRW